MDIRCILKYKMKLEIGILAILLTRPILVLATPLPLPVASTLFTPVIP